MLQFESTLYCKNVTIQQSNWVCKNELFKYTKPERF